MTPKSCFPILTVGHSDHKIEDFLSLLNKHQVDAVADVRSAPYSRRHPQFSRDELKASLREAGIEYWFMGKALGARSADSSCYDADGVAVYERIAETSEFKAAITSVIAASAKHRVALMCAEKAPLDCHRTVMVARHLQTAGGEILHILHDGEIVTHQQIEQDLLAMTNSLTGDLFGAQSSDSQLNSAYEKRGREIAYRLPPEKA